ncbi:hypothetical protein DWV75_03635 [Ruminococcus sp. AF12-5]|nr:hypothetical protein DWV75_03635 [Ruminococcus sp. AF12-5]
MAKYGVVRTDNMTGTDVRSELVSVKYMGENKKTATEIENGSVLKASELADGEREVFIGEQVSKDTPIREVVLIAAPEVPYDERLRNLDEFINVAGKACRGYRLHSGNIFSLTKEALTGLASPAKGNVVELADKATKLNVVAAATASTTTVGKIIDVEIAGRYTYYVIKVD